MLIQWIQQNLSGVTVNGTASVLGIATGSAAFTIASPKSLLWIGTRVDLQEIRVYQYSTQIPRAELALWSPSVELIAFDVNYRDLAPFVAGLGTALRAIRDITATRVLWSYTTQEGGALRVLQRAAVFDVVSLSAPSGGSRTATTISGLSRGDLSGLSRGMARAI